MSFRLVMPPDVTPAGQEDATLGLLARAGMVAVRAADLASPCGRGLGKDGRTAQTAAGHPADHARLGWRSSGWMLYVPCRYGVAHCRAGSSEVAELGKRVIDRGGSSRRRVRASASSSEAMPIG
jgi:hypothetical protein